MDDFLYLAPIRGITNNEYRTAFARYFDGFDASVAPFISTQRAKSINVKVLRDIIPENNSLMPVTPQILGNDGPLAVLLAKAMQSAGHNTVNLNLGCPYPMVAKKKRGSGLLCQPDLLKRYLDTVFSEFDGDVTIKTRLGRHYDDEIFKLVELYNQYPVKELIVHPRNGIQLYTGVPNLDAFSYVTENVSFPVVYNGDICSVSDFKKLKKLFPTISRWMIGRGAIFWPQLAAEIKAGKEGLLSEDELRDKYFCLHEDLYRANETLLDGPAHLMARMKAYWSYFSFWFDNDASVQKKIHKLKHPEQYLSMATQAIRTEPLRSHVN